jgi:hypothetical protein
VKFSPENPGSPLFTEDIVSRYPGLKGGKFWKEEHDLLLLRAVLKYVSDISLYVKTFVCIVIASLLSLLC